MAHTIGANQLRIPATGNAVTTNPLTASFTCPAGTTVLWLGLDIAGTTARTGGNPTYNSVEFTECGAKRDAGEGHVSTWFLLNPPTGSSYTISIPNAGALAMGAFVATAAAASGFLSALDNADGAATTGSNPAASITFTR